MEKTKEELVEIIGLMIKGGFKMRSAYIKKRVPESIDDCGNLDCKDCIFDCPSHAESIFRKED